MEREIQTKKEELYNTGYQSGLVTKLERDEEEQTKRGIQEGFDMEIKEARAHGKTKAEEMLRHLK